MKSILTQKHQGAVAFEYIIILVIMAVAIFIAWKFLGNVLKSKSRDIGTFIQNNGQNELGRTAGENVTYGNGH